MTDATLQHAMQRASDLMTLRRVLGRFESEHGPVLRVVVFYDEIQACKRLALSHNVSRARDASSTSLNGEDHA